LTLCISIKLKKLQNYTRELTKNIKTRSSCKPYAPESYEKYLAVLPRKKRHELKRKKVRFQEKYPQAVLRESKDSEIFETFIKLHKTSDGDKGNFMNDEVACIFQQLTSDEGVENLLPRGR
jgi:hypothetical protein